MRLTGQVHSVHSSLTQWMLYKNTTSALPRQPLGSLIFSCDTFCLSLNSLFSVIIVQIELVAKLLEESVDTFGPQWPVTTLSACP